MKELSNLIRVPGARKDRKRRGRGYASGQGLTGGRGMKGQKARAGGSVPAGFEGGQMPLQRVLRKFGFTPLHHKEYSVVNVEQLNRFEDGTVVDVQMMLDNRLVSKLGYGIKILGRGKLEKKLTVIAHQFSKSAVEKIKAVGGEAKTIMDQEV